MLILVTRGSFNHLSNPLKNEIILKKKVLSGVFDIAYLFMQSGIIMRRICDVAIYTAGITISEIKIVPSRKFMLYPKHVVIFPK